MSLKRLAIPAIGFIAAVICFAIHSIVDCFSFLTMVQSVGSHALLFLIPLYEILFKKKFPLVLTGIITFHIFCCVVLGSVFNFYDLISWWDIYLHGFFGLVISFIAYYFFVICHGKKTNEFLMSTYVVGFGMGFGALWEIFEYLGDTWFDLDSQRVQESIGLGKSPVADTMEDLMITLVGIAVFFIIYIIVGAHIAGDSCLGNFRFNRLRCICAVLCLRFLHGFLRRYITADRITEFISFLIHFIIPHNYRCPARLSYGIGQRRCLSASRFLGRAAHVYPRASARTHKASSLFLKHCSKHLLPRDPHRASTAAYQS